MTMTPETVRAAVNRVRGLVESPMFLHGTASEVGNIDRVVVVPMSLDEALRTITSFPEDGRMSVYGPDMSFDDDRGRLMSTLRTAAYQTPLTKDADRLIGPLTSELIATVFERVEDEGGEPGLAGSIECDLTGILRFYAAPDFKFEHDLREYIELLVRVYEKGGVPVGWEGFFPKEGKLVVRVEPE